jgi:hypothetical protein
MTGVPKKIIEQAEKEFPLYLERIRKKGDKVVVLKPPYHDGLINVRGLLEVNGIPKRIFFHEGKWRRV